MGCIESIENKFHEIDERLRQVFEADKYFVDNMQTVATCHAFKQGDVLLGFQQMQTNKQTTEQLRKFMQQLRNIDFIVVGRIMLELCLQAKNSSNQLLNTCANYDLKNKDIRKNNERANAFAQCKTDEERQQEVIRSVMEKLCESYNILKVQDEEKQRLAALNKLLKERMLDINKAVNTVKQANDAKQPKWTDVQESQLAALYNKLDEIYLQAGANGGKVPKELTLQKFKQKMNNIDKVDEDKEQKCYKLDSYTRAINIVDKINKEQLKKPEVENHESKQFRYLFLNQHAYHNYALYLQDIQNELIKKWEEEYETWKKQNQENQVKNAEIWKQYHESDEKQRKLEAQAKQNQIEQLKKQQEQQKQEEEKLKEKLSKMTPEEKQVFEKKQKEEKEAIEKKQKEENDKKLQQRVDDPGDVNKSIQKGLEEYRNWVIKKGKQPTLQDVINNPNFFLDDHLSYWNRGLKMVAKGRVALVLLAGDSDLKWNYKQDAQEIQNPYTDEQTPFGFRTTGLNSQKCLFQLFCERVEAVQRLAHMYRPDRTFLMENSRVHIYVMTNSENDHKTRKLFRKYLNFGLWAKNIHFFQQGNFPMIGKNNGQIRLRDKLRLMSLPDGTGGFYDAVHNNELLKEWDFLGIKYLHVMGIDNLLGRPVDPTLLGMLNGVDGVQNGLDIVTKAVEVLDENENLSRLVVNQNNNNGHNFTVLRVSELKSANSQVAEQCKLAVYNDFACTTEFVKKAIEKRNDWEAYHVSEKKYEYGILEKGQYQKLQEPSYIFEKDILDPLVIVQPKMFGVLQVNRKNEYAPVKRLNRSDQIAPSSFHSAIVQMSLLHFKWLIDHGFQFEKIDFYTRENLLQEDDVAKLYQTLSQVKLENQIFTNAGYKQFIGEQTEEEQEKLQSEKKAAQDKKLAEREKARKKKAIGENKPVEQVELNPPSSDEEEEEEEPKTLFKDLVEIDARQSLHGENIPQPKLYVDILAYQDTKKETLPFYLKSNANPIKCKLPWKLNEIYRYI